MRSFEATHVGALFHPDGHQGSLKVLNRRGEWITPIALGVIDDYSRLICHLQWSAFFRIDVASTIFMLPAELVVPGRFACHKGTIGQPLQAPSYG